MDGFEATRQIKTIRPEIPIIALSAYTLKEDKISAKLAGCDDFISKPIDTTMFNSVLLSLIKKLT